MNCEEYVIELLKKEQEKVNELTEALENKKRQLVQVKGQLDELQSIITLRGKKNIFYSTNTQEIEITVSNRGFNDVETDLFNYLNSEFPNLPVTEYGKPEPEKAQEETE